MDDGQIEMLKWLGNQPGARFREVRMRFAPNATYAGVRSVDRALQKLRRSGLIEYRKRPYKVGWHLTPEGRKALDGTGRRKKRPEAA